MPNNLNADISTYVEYVRIITDSSVNTSVIVYHTAELVSGSLASQHGKLGIVINLYRLVTGTTALHVNTQRNK
jgi:hypothetical protein